MSLYYQGPEGTTDLRDVKPDWDDYLEHMSQDGTWADEIILRAVAHWLKINILVVTSSPQGAGDQTHKWIISNDKYKGQPIRLGHIWEWHYKSLGMHTLDLKNKISNFCLNILENHEG